MKHLILITLLILSSCKKEEDKPTTIDKGQPKTMQVVVTNAYTTILHNNVVVLGRTTQVYSSDSLLFYVEPHIINGEKYLARFNLYIDGKFMLYQEGKEPYTIRYQVK